MRRTRRRPANNPRRTRQRVYRSRSTPQRHGTLYRYKWRLLVLVIVLIPVWMYISWLDNQVRAAFEGKRWALPAQVYARSLELYGGMSLKPIIFKEELRAIGYRSTNQLFEPGQYQQKGNDIYITTRAFQFWDASEPSRMVRVRIRNNQVASIKDVQNNESLALLRLQPKLIGKIYPTHNEDRVLVKLEEVPRTLIEGLIAMEDRQFYEHNGISVRGLLRATLANMRAGEWVQGGSTVTQQLIKNLYLTSDRNLQRKFKEAVMALLLEWHYEKDEILEAYLNEVYLGQDGSRSIHGMGMAARFYFKRPLHELKLHETALLVSLVRAASHYNPRANPERAVERRNLVLQIMAEQGVIEPLEAEIAKQANLGVTQKPPARVSPYPAFLKLVRQQLQRDYHEEDLRSEGLQIFTTLDPIVQKQAERAMINGIRKLEKSNKRVKKLQGAMVVTSSENGEVLAMVNGRNPRFDGFNRPLDAVRQIGSLVKPAVYLTALEQSHMYSLVSTLDDVPYEWEDERTGEIWKPRNYDLKPHGRVKMYQALAKSYNLATVHLGMELGLDRVQDTLRKMGIERDFKMYPSTLLGSLSLSPLEVAQMYQTVASSGFSIPVRAIRNVLTHDGKPLQRYALSVEQRFDPEPMYVLHYALQEVVRNSTGRSMAKQFSQSEILAGKTGSTNDLRDSWFAGFSSELLVVTWLGRDDNRPIHLSGGKGAMQVWADFFKASRPQADPPIIPKGIQWRWVNHTNGSWSRRGSRGAVKMPFIGRHSASLQY